MSEKYLVMTEAEFEAALSAQRRFTAHDSNDQDDEIKTDELWTRLQEAEAACRAREVKESDLFIDTWELVEREEA